MGKKLVTGAKLQESIWPWTEQMEGETNESGGLAGILILYLLPLCL